MFNTLYFTPGEGEGHFILTSLFIANSVAEEKKLFHSLVVTLHCNESSHGWQTT